MLSKKYFKKIFCVALSVSMLLGSVNISTAYAEQKMSAKIVSTSNNVLSGYYIEYEINGKRYRSNEVGINFNAKVWELLSESDKMKIAETFAFGPRYKLEQFGQIQSQVISDFVNETQGWTEAKRIWNDKIANKYFPDFEEKLSPSSDWYRREYDFGYISSSPEPEDIKWREKIKELEQVYGVAVETYRVVRQLKANQSEIATKALSGDIISIIADKALVPAITVKGTAGITSDFIQTVWTYVDGNTGMTEDIYNDVIGERLTASKGAELIGKLGKILENNVEFINACLARMEVLKAEIIQEKENAMLAKSERMKKARDKDTEYEQAKKDEINGTTYESDSSIQATLQELKRKYEETGITEEEKTKRLNAYIQASQNYFDDVLSDFNSYKDNITARKKAIKDALDSKIMTDRISWSTETGKNYGKYILENSTIIFPGGILSTEQINELRTELSSRRARNNRLKEYYNQYKMDLEQLFGTAKSGAEPIVKRYKAVKEYAHSSTMIILDIESAAKLLINNIPDSIESAMEYSNAIVQGMEDIIDEIEDMRTKSDERLEKIAVEYLAYQNEYEERLAEYENVMQDIHSIIDDIPDYVKSQKNMLPTDTLSEIGKRENNELLFDSIYRAYDEDRQNQINTKRAELKNIIDVYELKMPRAKELEVEMKYYYKQLNQIGARGQGNFDEWLNKVNSQVKRLSDLEAYTTLKENYAIPSETKSHINVLKIMYRDFYGGDRWDANAINLYQEIMKPENSDMNSGANYSKYIGYSSRVRDLEANARYYSYTFGKRPVMDIYTDILVPEMKKIEEKHSSGGNGGNGGSGGINFVALTALQKESEEPITMKVGDILELTPIYVPENASDKVLAWISNDENILRIKNWEQIEAVSEGTVVVRAMSVGNNNIYTDYTINVVGGDIVIDSEQKLQEIQEQLEEINDDLYSQDIKEGVIKLQEIANDLQKTSADYNKKLSIAGTITQTQVNLLMSNPIAITTDTQITIEDDERLAQSEKERLQAGLQSGDFEGHLNVRIGRDDSIKTADNIASEVLDYSISVYNEDEEFEGMFAHANFDKGVEIRVPYNFIKYPTNKYDLSLKFYDKTQNAWTIVEGATFIGGMANAKVNHLTDFAVFANLKPIITPSTPIENEETEENEEPSILPDDKVEKDDDEQSDFKSQSSGGGSAKETSSTKQDSEKVIQEVKNEEQKQTAQKEHIKIDIKLTDIQGHWAEENIKKAVARNIVSGYSDSTFRPNNKIIRAEFITMVVKAFNLTSNKTKEFKDTKKHWAKEMIAIAYDNGIIQGSNSNEFRPDDAITREQIAVILNNILKLQKTKSVNFKDKDSISEWSKEAIEVLSANQIINGYTDGTFKAKEVSTRAEAITILLNAIEFKENK